MKGCILLFVFIVFGSLGLFAQDENTRYLSSFYEFEKGNTELLYGDKVVLRNAPSKDAESLDTLKIAAPVKILEKTSSSMDINGIDSYWYKVKAGKKTGYILGGLIALDHKNVDGTTYLVTMAHRDDNYYARCRAVQADKSFYGHESRLNTNSFYLEAFGKRGLEGIKNMACINLVAEACMVDGGEIYLFNDGSRLIEAINLSSISDAGAFWFHESLVFPEDEGGYEGIVQYERESGMPITEDYEWTRSIINSVVLRWENGKFTPDIKRLDFEAE